MSCSKFAFPNGTWQGPHRQQSSRSPWPPTAPFTQELIRPSIRPVLLAPSCRTRPGPDRSPDIRQSNHCPYYISVEKKQCVPGPFRPGRCSRADHRDFPPAGRLSSCWIQEVHGDGVAARRLSGSVGVRGGRRSCVIRYGGTNRWRRKDIYAAADRAKKEKIACRGFVM